MFPVLFALTISGRDLLLYGALAVAGAAIVALLLRKDHERERRRESASDIASFFDSIGLEHSGDFFRKYSIGDYSGMWVAAKTIIGIVKNPATRTGALRAAAKKYIAEAMKDPNEAQVLLKEVGQQATANGVKLAATAGKRV